MNIEDILHDPTFMWVLIDILYNSPTLVCRTAEEALEAVVGSDRYSIKPVKIYTREDKQ